MKKVYYQIELKQTSPLRIGNGDSEVTDSDLILDGRGLPFIPGSSLAGVLRDTYKNTFHISDEEMSKNPLFGYVDGENLADSHVIISDAVLPVGAKNEDLMITVRDGVGLDQWGATIKGCKYDFQVVETELFYKSVLEWSGDEDSYKNEIVTGMDKLLSVLIKDGISLGARSTRGYGRMSVTVRKKEFNFPDQLSEWLNYDPFSENAFAECNEMDAGESEKGLLVIKADIALKGSFLVRVRTERAEELDNGSNPDAVPLTNREKKPVIPGTSWAGVFRHHMKSLLRESGVEVKEGELAKDVDMLFGKSEINGQHIRSLIRFAETSIEGGKDVLVTRNAVERFTQAPRNSALYTNLIWQGGKGTLEITCPENKISKLQKQLLAASIIDLDNGLLTVGAESSVGRGICEVVGLTVNGADQLNALKALDTDFLEVKHE